MTYSPKEREILDQVVAALHGHTGELLSRVVPFGEAAHECREALECGSLLPLSSASLLALGRTDSPQAYTPKRSAHTSPISFATPKGSSPAGWLRKAAAGCRTPRLRSR